VYNARVMKILSNREPWYAGGLAFECVRCGRCCAGPAEGYVWVTPEEVRRIAEFLGQDVGDFRNRYCRRVGRRTSLVEDAETKDCVFLRRDGEGLACCAVYPVRPTQCRTWPFWPSNLLDRDAWALAAMRCPGVNRGPLHGLDEIERKRRRTRT